MKKKYMIAIVISVLLLVGVVLVLTVSKDNGKTDKDNTGNDVIIHETDEDTVEEKAEDGLKESDSEDGPVLDEDNMIDFNGGDSQSEGGKKTEDNQGDASKPNNNPSDGTDNDGDGDDTGEEPSEGDEEEEDSEDTGSWGRFY